MSITIDKLNRISHKYSKDIADDLVFRLNSTEDACDWVYKAKQTKESEPYYFIAIYDEDGNFLGYL